MLIRKEVTALNFNQLEIVLIFKFCNWILSINVHQGPEKHFSVTFTDHLYFCVGVCLWFFNMVALLQGNFCKISNGRILCRSWTIWKKSVKVNGIYILLLPQILPAFSSWAQNSLLLEKNSHCGFILYLTIYISVRQ